MRAGLPHDIYGFRKGTPGAMAQYLKFPTGAINHKVIPAHTMHLHITHPMPIHTSSPRSPSTSRGTMLPSLSPWPAAFMPSTAATLRRVA